MGRTQQYNGKVAIVTGASSGIGKSIAEEFAKSGIHLVLAARTQAKLEEVASQCRSHGAKAIEMPTDVSEQEQCYNLVNTAIHHFHQLDILVNNAGISMRALFEDMDLSVMKRTMDINFWGAVYCTHAALPYLLESRGQVIGISSIAGFRGLPARTAYSASKFAMNGFLEALRTENRKTGLKVLTVCPGFTASNIRESALDANGQPQGATPRSEEAMMQPETVAKAVLKAMKRQQKLLILTRQGRLTVFLNKLANGLMDRLVFNHMAREADSPLRQEPKP